jgi:hypothetical protein
MVNMVIGFDLATAKRHMLLKQAQGLAPQWCCHSTGAVKGDPVAQHPLRLGAMGAGADVAALEARSHTQGGRGGNGKLLLVKVRGHLGFQVKLKNWTKINCLSGSSVPTHALVMNTLMCGK